MKLDVRHLEIHVAHACNLACESCSHYSNYRHTGVVSIEDADRWMGAWSARLRPETFSLVGGEPTIHPRLADFVRLARTHWPDSRLRLVTNGFFLHKHPQLPEVLKGDRKASIYLSLHHDSPAYRNELRPNLELLRRWTREYGLSVRAYLSFRNWRRVYRDGGSAMRPYADGRPRRSWERCVAKSCPQLFEGAIWKCSPLAYLGMQHDKFGLSEEWAPYLAYQPLRPDCGDAELREFFAREDEPVCAMCPAEPERFKMPSPLGPAQAHVGRRMLVRVGAAHGHPDRRR